MEADKSFTDVAKALETAQADEKQAAEDVKQAKAGVVKAQIVLESAVDLRKAAQVEFRDAYKAMLGTRKRSATGRGPGRPKTAKVAAAIPAAGAANK